METTSHIWSSFSDYIRNFIRSKVPQSCDVDDILQEVFLKVHMSLSSLKNEDRLQSWLFSITRNAINDHYRSNSKLNESELKTDVVEEGDDEFERLKDCLRPFIDRLPPKYKRPLFLSDVKGMKQKEVAKIIGLSETATKSRIQRAREMVKANFVSCCKFEIGEGGKLKGEHAC